MLRLSLVSLLCSAAGVITLLLGPGVIPLRQVVLTGIKVPIQDLVPVQPIFFSVKMIMTHGGRLPLSMSRYPHPISFLVHGLILH